MSVVLSTAWRLSRAGGRFRVLAVGVGAAVTTLLAAVATALPDAVAVGVPEVDVARRQDATSVGVFVVCTALTLLLGVSRLSSFTRDRRLASLRMIGVPTRQARLVAACETALLCMPGAVAGSLAAAWAGPVLLPLLGDAVTYLTRPVDIEPVAALVVPIAVTTAASAVSAAALRTGTDVRSGRAEATLRVASWWRSLGLLAPITPLALLLTLGADAPAVDLLLAVGGLGGVVGVALVAPVLTRGVATALVRHGGTTAMLTGRALQVQSAGTARVVAGLCVAVYLSVTAFGTLAAAESTPQYRYAVQSATDGPSVLGVTGTSLTSATLRATSGVLGVRDTDVVVLGCDGETCPQVFVGTCADLAAFMVASGCQDDRAAVVSWSIDGKPREDVAGSVTLTRGADPQGRPRPASVTVPIAAEKIVEDVDATAGAWVYPDLTTLFVPVGLASGLGEPASVTITVDGGSSAAAAVGAALDRDGLTATPYPLDDLADVARVRSLVYLLVGLVLSAGLLLLTLGTVDRAIERRRLTGRLVALGTPIRIVRLAASCEVLVAMASGLVVAACLGCLLAAAYLGIDGSLVDGGVLARRILTLACLVVVAIAVAATAGWGTVRARMTPDLLRQE